MAVTDDTCARLVSQPATPIALLNPALDNQASRVVHGEVTLTWPYNSIKNTVAFLLAEPDVRLRRVKGQVRIELHGVAAKAVAGCGIGGGDSIILSLNGADWAKDESPGRIPGARLDWQLRFKGRLILQAKLGETGEVKNIDVDYSEVEASPPPLPQPAMVESQSAAPQEAQEPPATTQKAPSMDLGEYPSPAFIKRARISYGALFEGGLDIFEEDGGVKGKGRKRSRFGHESNAWRYSSQSLSPEPTSPADEAMGEYPVKVTPSRLQMLDEGAQTAELPAMLPAPDAVEASGPEKSPEQSRTVEQSVCDVHADPVDTPDSHHEPSPTPQSPVVTREPQITMFGTPKPAHTTFSMFGTKIPARPESGFNLVDQVRFGFSHVPQSSDAPVPPETQPVQDSGYHGEGSSAYPETYLDPTPHSQNGHTLSYFDDAHDAALRAPHDSNSVTVPSAAQEFSQVQWAFSAPSHDHDRIEDDQLCEGALNEETAVAVDGGTASFGELSPIKNLEGFSGYGTHINLVATEPVINEAHAEDLLQQDPPDEEKMTANEETPDGSDNDVTVESEGEEDIGGDYDQRNYNISDDDDEGVSDDDEFERDGEVRGEEYSYDEDEDGYGEHWEEDEEDEVEESEEEDRPRAFAPQPPPKPAPTGPVVISLLSDSEDDDEPSPAPVVPEANSVGGRRHLPPRILPAQMAPSRGPPSQPSIADLANAAHHHGRQGSRADTEKASEHQKEEGVFPFAERRVQVIDFASSLGGPAQPEALRSIGAIEEGSIGEDAEMDNADDMGGQNDDHSPPEYVLHSGREEFVPRQSDRNYPPGEEQDMKYGDDHDSADGSASDDDMPGSYTAEDEMDVEEIEEIEEIEEAEELEDIEIEELEGVEEIEEAEGADVTQDGDITRAWQTSEDSSRDSNDQPQLVEEARLAENEEGEVDSDAYQPSVADEVVLIDEDDIEMAETTQLGTEAENQKPPMPFLSEDLAPAEMSGEDEADSSLSARPASASDSKDHRELEPEPMNQDEAWQRQQPDGNAASDISSHAIQSFSSEGHSSSHMPASASTVTSNPPHKKGAHGYQLLTPMETRITAETVTEAQLVDEGEDRDIQTQPTGQKGPDKPFDGDPVPVPEFLSPRHLAHSSVDLGRDHSPARSLPSVTDIVPTGDQALRTLVDEAVEEVADVPEESTENPGDAVAVSRAKDSKEHDRASAEGDTATVSAPVSVIMGGVDHDEKDTQSSPQSVRRSTRNKQRSTPVHSSPSSSKIVEDQITVQGYHTHSYEANVSHFSSDPPSPDLSIHLARQAVAAKRPKKALEPLRVSPRITRARSSSLQMSITSEADDEEDASISLAKAALASPSKPNIDHSDDSTASLKAELTKRMRSHRECISLKTLRNRLDDHPDVLAVVTTQPPAAVRAKGGPREYVMTFNVTDPSTAPTQVIEVQLYRPHKESLPVVTPGDAILLQKFQVKSFSKRGFGLRSHSDSAWGVFDTDEGPPQIKGPPVEDWEQYSEYMGLLRAWYRSMDGAAKGKIEKANKKLEEASQGK